LYVSYANFVTDYFLLKIKILAKREREITQNSQIRQTSVLSWFWNDFRAEFRDVDKLVRRAIVAVLSAFSGFFGFQTHSRIVD